jgi:amino acid transporter
LFWIHNLNLTIYFIILFQSFFFFILNFLPINYLKLGSSILTVICFLFILFVIFIILFLFYFVFISSRFYNFIADQWLKRIGKIGSLGQQPLCRPIGLIYRYPEYNQDSYLTPIDLTSILPISPID